MSKKFLESEDLFLDFDWLGCARDLQNKLESVRNPYVGNKRKLIIDLAKVLQYFGLVDVVRNNGKVLDLFSGSAFVSYFFKKMGSAVWSNDLLASSYLNAVAFVENNQPSTCDWSSFDIAKEEPDNFVTKNYCGTRFTKEEARRLDIIRTNLKKFIGSKCLRSFINDMGDPVSGYSFGNDVIKDEYELFGSKKNDFAHSVVGLVHHVMNHCYVGGRLNNGQVLANLDHRLSHARNQGMEIDFTAIPRYNLAFSNGIQSTATRMDAIELLKIIGSIKDFLKFDVVYIDPPYGGEQSDYASMYGFFEDFLGFGDAHKITDADRFSSKKTYEESFKELLSLLPEGACWILSYNDSSWSNLEKIESCIKDFRKDVKSVEVDYRYQYRSKEKSSGKEYIIVVHP